VVGGSTSVNAMVYMRGSPADYDEWAADGATGWAYPDVLPYFRRAEDNERGASRFHGAGGPLRVSENRSRHPLAAAFLDAAWQAGIPKNADVNGAEQEGVHWHQVTQRDGRRCSAAAAYLHPALRHRRNLTLLANSPALRLLWPPGPARGRVTGVEYLRDGRVARASAAREVIVCAGTYQSAVLLMVSGIGPADQLRSLGIEAGQDLPVGENLQDHIMTCLVYHTDEISLLGAFSPENVHQYQQYGRGPLSSGSGEAGGFIRSSSAVDGPDFQVAGLPTMFDNWREITRHGVSISGWPAKPTSRGSVRLRAADALTKPRIRHNYLSTDYDRKVTADGLRRMLEIAEQPAFKAVTTGPFAIPESSSDPDLLAFSRAHCTTTWHPVASCAIGQVVDPELRVFGVDGLRVADASVMPSVPRGNTGAVTVMIGEKAADLIKAG
jgi:choline dehydrogenase-like flavoprotein